MLADPVDGKQPQRYCKEKCNESVKTAPHAASRGIALDRDFPHNNLPLAIGETGWPSCGAARAFPYSFATLPYAERFVRNVAQWMLGQHAYNTLANQIFLGDWRAITTNCPALKELGWNTEHCGHKVQ